MLIAHSYLNSNAILMIFIQVKLLVYREERQGDDLYQVLEVDLVKKPGKGLGLGVIGRKDRPGVSISEIVSTYLPICILPFENRENYY